jgi:hypothetical protein
MKTIKKFDLVVVLVMIAATLLFISSCKKPHHPPISPWHKKSIGVSTPQRGIIEMSTYGQNTAYGLTFDVLNAPLHDITFTHDGGANWNYQTIAGLEDNYLFGVAATTASTVHVFGANYAKGGGNVFILLWFMLI